MKISSIHPVITAFYFLSVIVFAMFTLNPWLQIIAFLGGTAYLICIEGKIKFKSVCVYAVLFIAIALSNPLFSHKGVTALFFFNGNPITLEAVLYGINLAVMLISVLVWFKCISAIMTEDKLLCVMGKISSKIALLSSSAIRFIPLFKQRAAIIRRSQITMGMFSSDIWTDKLRSNIRVFSSLVTWALENAVDTGASMKSRGYGLKGRKSYTYYTLNKNDTVIFILILLLDVILAVLIANGTLDFVYYPRIDAAKTNVFSIVCISAYAILCFIPFVFELKENLRWKYYKSRI